MYNVSRNRNSRNNYPSLLVWANITLHTMAWRSEVCVEAEEKRSCYSARSIDHFGKALSSSSFATAESDAPRW